MSVPARLVYEDSNNTTQVIGRYNPQGVDGGRISTITIDENAKAYNKVIIEGDPSLQKRMPVKNSEFGTSEREIIVEVDTDNDGNFERRQRVFPQTAGNTNDDGRYKNKTLYGFKKSVGEDDVTVSSTSTDIEDVLQKALPSNYSVSYPSGETPPSVENFTFNGSRQQLFTDLRKEFDHFVIFTGQLDGSGNDEVLLQPQGFGGVQFDLVRGEDPFIYDYFKPRDTSNVVSKVQVIGTTPKGTQIDKTFEANVGNLTDLPEPDATRFIRHKTDTLGGSQTRAESQAEEIARSIIDPTATTNLAVDTQLRTSSNLNQSVGIIDDSRNVDENNILDDVFTVVKQKDYLHDGLTYLSFEFESESTQHQREKWRNHDSEQANLYPSNQRDVGNQGISDNTNGESATLQRDQDAEASGSSTDSTKELEKDPNTGVEQGGGATVIEDDDEVNSFSTGLDDQSFDKVGDFSADVGNDGATGMLLNIRAENLQSKTGTDFNGIEVGVEVDGEEVAEINGNYPTFTLLQMPGGMLLNIHMHVPANIDDNDDVDVNLRCVSGSTDPIVITTLVQYIDTHDHDDDIEIQDEFGNQKPEMVDSTTAEANITSQPKFTEDGQHVHTIDVTTEEELVDFFEQNKTDK